MEYLSYEILRPQRGNESRTTFGWFNGIQILIVFFSFRYWNILFPLARQGFVSLNKVFSLSVKSTTLNISKVTEIVITENKLYFQLFIYATITKFEETVIVMKFRISLPKNFHFVTRYLEHKGDQWAFRLMILIKHYIINFAQDILRNLNFHFMRTLKRWRPEFYEEILIYKHEERAKLRRKWT